MRNLLLLMLLLVSVSTWAHDFEVNGIYYVITSSTDLTVSVSYRGYRYEQYTNEYLGDFVIPEDVTYNGKTYSVTSIGEYAFECCSGLTSITIPSSVMNIGAGAFCGCISLPSISIPDGVTSIGHYTFNGCSMSSISIPDGVTSIEEGAFIFCYKLDRLICLAAFPPTIGSGVFYESKLLSGGTVYIPKGTMASYQEKWGTELNYVEMPSVELNDDNVDEDNNIDITIVDCTENSITVKVSSKSPIDIEIIVNGVKISITNLKALSDVSAVRNADGTYTINGVRTGDVIKFVAKNNATAIEDVTTSRPTIEGIYNLQGQKLSVPQRGVNIINGKKVVVK